MKLIRTIKGCQAPEGEPPLIPPSISCAGALSRPERRYELFLIFLVLTAAKPAQRFIADNHIYSRPCTFLPYFQLVHCLLYFGILN